MKGSTPDEIMPDRLFYVRWWNDGARRWYRSPHSFKSRQGAERYRDEQLGFPWGVVGGDPYGDRQLLVFVRDDEVVKHFYIRPIFLDDPVPPGDCRTPEDESTRL